MKQLIIGQNKAYATGVTYADLTKVPEGTIGIFSLVDGSLIASNTNLKGSVAIVCGRGTDKMPIHFPEIDVRSLTVERAEYQKGATFSGKITVPTTEKGKHYTVIVAKLGTVFNERNRWSYSSMAKSDIAADVAADIVKQLNANTETSGVKAISSGGVITITAVEEGVGYEIIGADELMGVKPTNVTAASKAILDKAYVQDLASRCAAGKGFNDVYQDGESIYPGYPEVVDSDQYVLYTLRFAVPRVAAKQRDEVVYQLLHIAVPKGSACVTTLDAIFDVSAPTSSSLDSSIGDDSVDDTTCDDSETV